MRKRFLDTYDIDYIEIYTPMAKSLVYWHTQALGFTEIARYEVTNGRENFTSHVIESNKARLVLTSTYPTYTGILERDVDMFVSQNYCGVKRFALQVKSVTDAFEMSIENGAIPLKPPTIYEDEFGIVEESAIKLFDNNEIVFVNTKAYKGVFKPGYRAVHSPINKKNDFIAGIDHIASEVRINESNLWTNYLTNTINTELVQSMNRSEDNKTGLVLNINQSYDRKLTIVIAEPDHYNSRSKTQLNIDRFGPGIHHIAFHTTGIVNVIKELSMRNVEFVNFPNSYYDILRSDKEFEGIDIDILQENGIIIDKENNSYLLQKFLRPISDRPFFLYEIVERVNDYHGFALKNINILKKAEELEIIKGSN